MHDLHLKRGDGECIFYDLGVMTISDAICDIIKLLMKWLHFDIFAWYPVSEAIKDGFMHHLSMTWNIFRPIRCLSLSYQQKAKRHFFDKLDLFIQIILFYNKIFVITETWRMSSTFIQSHLIMLEIYVFITGVWVV